MSACTQCGTPARPTDKFCNACGTPIGRAGSPAGPAAPYATPPPYAPAGAPPPLTGFGGGPLPRCQMGHEIAPGQSYCPQGHPFALDQMQFANDAYPGPGNFGAPQPPQYVPPPPLPPLPGGPGAPPMGGPAFGQPPPPPAFAQQPPPPPAFGQPPPAFGQPPPPPPFAPPAAAAATAFANMDTGREPVSPKALRGFLVAFGTNPNGDFWPLAGGRLVIGRLGAADRTDIGLQDPTISSRHAAMIVDAANGTVTVEDTGSTNGTFVNDEHIGFNGKRELRDGDRVRFGAFTTIVKVLGRV